jgi:hypothetical protein
VVPYLPVPKTRISRIKKIGGLVGRLIAVKEKGEAKFGSGSVWEPSDSVWEPSAKLGAEQLN